MGRSWDGTDDRISYSSDAGIGGFVTQTISLWLRRSSTTTIDSILAKDRPTAAWELAVNAGQNLQWTRDWTVDGQYTFGSLNDLELHHVALVYDGTSTGPPTAYVDGSSRATTVVAASSGSIGSDAAAPLVQGETGTGLGDFGGEMAHLVYANALYSAEDVNRCRWWGTRGGSPEVYHPMDTDSLVNKGTSTAANGTATGTTMASLPRVERRWGAGMGCGR